VLLFDAGGLAGFDLKTGKELWRHEWETIENMNIMQPIVLDDERVFISSETSNGCAMLKVTRMGTEFSVEQLWSNKNMAAKQANPVRVGRYIYGMHNGTLVCLDTDRKGMRMWRGKNFGQGQMLAIAQTLLILSEQGELVLVPADPEKYRELGQMKVFEAPRTWNTPALAGRYLYLRNDLEMVCLALPLRE
jgi:outer membrane protein assembly factor BamB